MQARDDPRKIVNALLQVKLSYHGTALEMKEDEMVKELKRTAHSDYVDIIKTAENDRRSTRLEAMIKNDPQNHPVPGEITFSQIAKAMKKNYDEKALKKTVEGPEISLLSDTGPMATTLEQVLDDTWKHFVTQQQLINKPEHADMECYHCGQKGNLKPDCLVKNFEVMVRNNTERRNYEN